MPNMFHIDRRVHTMDQNSEQYKSLVKLYKKFNKIADALDKTVVIEGIETIEYRVFGNWVDTFSVNETNANFNDVKSNIWVDASGEKICGGKPIFERDGIKYSRSSQLPSDVEMCQSCGHVHTESTCPQCQGVARCGTHEVPKTGWLVQKTKDDTSDSGKFGFEIEMELPEQGDRYERVRQAIRETGVALPGVLETDGSLRHGLEYVTHPMTWNYLLENNEAHTKLIRKLVELGAQDKSYASQNQNAGIHVHVDHPGASHMIAEANDWLANTYHQRLALSMREESRFKSYSGGKTGREGYNYLGQRHHKTWELRGFSFKMLMEHPDALPHLAAYADSMTGMLSDVNEFNRLSTGSLYNLLKTYEYHESADWWHDNFGSIVTDPFVDQFRIDCEKDYKCMLEKWCKVLTCREVVLREDWDPANSSHSWLEDERVRETYVSTVTIDTNITQCNIYGNDGYGRNSNTIKTINIRPKYMTDEESKMMPPKTFEEYFEIRKMVRDGVTDMFDPATSARVEEMAVA